MIDLIEAQTFNAFVTMALLIVMLYWCGIALSFFFGSFEDRAFFWRFLFGHHKNEDTSRFKKLWLYFLAYSITILVAIWVLLPIYFIFKYIIF